MKILRLLFIVLISTAIVACVEDRRDYNTAAQQQEQTEIQGQDNSQVETNGGEENSDSLQANNNENEGDEVEKNESENDETSASDNNNQGNGQQENQPSNPSNEEITDSAGSDSWVSLFGIILGASALVLYAYNFYVSRKREDEQKSEIEKLKKNIESNWIKTQRAFKECAPDKDLKKIADAVNVLEPKVYGLECEIKKTRKPGSGGNGMPEPEEVVSERTGYFGIPRGNDDKLILFNEKWDYQADKAYFKVEYIDELNCNFYPFDLEKLRSVDAVKKAINFTGCSIQYAKKMKVNQKGFAIYNQENEYWQLIDKAEIELMN